MTLRTNLYRLWFVIPALFDWPKERFPNHFDEKYGESNHVSSSLYFLRFLIGSKSFLFERCLPPSSTAKFTSNCVFISSSDVPWRKYPFISFFHRRKVGNLCFRLISAVA